MEQEENERNQGNVRFGKGGSQGGVKLAAVVVAGSLILISASPGVTGGRTCQVTTEQGK